MRHDSRQAGSRRSPDSQTPASPDGRTDAGRVAAAKKRQEHEVCDAKRRDDGWMTRRFSSFPYAKPSDLQPVVVGPILMCIDVV